MILTEIDHIVIAVRDLAVAIACDVEAFGAEVHHREIVESDRVEEALVRVADGYIQRTAATAPILRSRVRSSNAARVYATSATGSTTARQRCRR